MSPAEAASCDLITAFRGGSPSSESPEKFAKSGLSSRN